MEDLPDGKKVVIFCRFLPEIDAIVTMLNEMEIPAASITGATAGQARSDLIDAFQEMEEPRVLVIQTQTGGLGITLTRADTAIFYSYSYSFADYEQARARIHRIGQTNKVTYIHLVARDTVDEAVINALHFKKRLADIVVDQQRDQADEGWLDAPAPPADVQAEL
jgi:SNF2 family DNA or RNA helicase